MNNKNILFFLVLFITAFLILSTGGIAQSYFPSSGPSRDSGFSFTITRTLDLLFGGIIQPIFDLFNFYNFYAAVRISLWIILYIIIYWVLSTRFEGFHPKYSKVIAVITALLAVAFTPDRILEIVFREILGGLIGFLLLGGVIFFPLYWLYQGTKDSEDRIVNLVAAFVFLLMLLFLTYLNDQLVNSISSGLIWELASITVALSSMVILILFIYYLVRVFRSSGEDEAVGHRERRFESPRRERRSELRSTEEFNREEREYRRIRELSRSLSDLATGVRGNIRELGRGPAVLALKLTGEPQRANVMSRETLNRFHGIITELHHELERVRGRDRREAGELAVRLVENYNDLHEPLEQFNRLMGDLQTNIIRCGESEAYRSGNANQFVNWFNGQADLAGFFREVSDILDRTDAALANMITILLGISH